MAASGLYFPALRGGTLGPVGIRKPLGAAAGFRRPAIVSLRLWPRRALFLDRWSCCDARVRDAGDSPGAGAQGRTRSCRTRLTARPHPPGPVGEPATSTIKKNERDVSSKSRPFA